MTCIQWTAKGWNFVAMVSAESSSAFMTSENAFHARGMTIGERVGTRFVLLAFFTAFCICMCIREGLPRAWDPR